MNLRWMIVVGLIAVPVRLSAQVDPTPYIERLAKGDTESVRSEVSDLVDRYPNDPGIRYLQGLVTEDGTDAVRVFQGLVDRHPDSEWADDALYKVYQFYYSIGLYRTADLKMEQLRRDYPSSPYASAKGTAAPPRVSDETGAGAEGAESAGSVAVEAGAGTHSGQFALQVGAYSARENADKQKFFFEDQGFPVEVINRVRDGRSLFIVLVGNYLTYEDAKTKSADIRKQYGVDSFVVSR